MIEAHGGELINRVVDNKEGVMLEKKAKGLKKILLNSREISDVEMIAIGGFSPLSGFMTEKDYTAVVENMRLSCGIVWPLPVTLSITEEEKEKIKAEKEIALVSEATGEIIAILEVEDIFEYDKENEAIKVFKTKDQKHPGVKYLFSQGKYLLGGELQVLRLPKHPGFEKYNLKPAEVRKIFLEKGWKTIAAFQTRNPIHRAHEYIQKCALEIVDGLFIHPIVGYTKPDDLPADVRMKAIEVLVENYYPTDRYLLSINPSAMRYAGPREAIFHAIIRKNYGCTHIIIGRDHAGVGSFYGPYDAQKIFSQFNGGELGIKPLFFENTFYCKKCAGMASSKTCPHKDEDRVLLSGTAVRKMLLDGKIPPPEFTRPEVAKILINALHAKRSNPNG